MFSGQTLWASSGLTGTGRYSTCDLSLYLGMLSKLALGLSMVGVLLTPTADLGDAEVPLEYSREVGKDHVFDEDFHLVLERAPLPVHMPPFSKVLLPERGHFILESTHLLRKDGRLTSRSACPRMQAP